MRRPPLKNEISRALLKRHELLAELCDVVERELVDLGTPADTARIVGAAVVDFLSCYWAGQVVSFPKDEYYRLTLKELEAWDMYTGNNLDQVARHFMMTPRGMRKLLRRIGERIKAQCKAQAAPGQGDLLGKPEPETEEL
ncbi:hypothetical protein FOZ74_15035 [Comamonas flocculans]|uniref:Mor transcription activator domain-containing protein n=1 Tax=Comamonas flocculans TaxID=2597701 RepID=A0A5B8S149_9BURK|nr:hypothetical protein FOZ74_15035 [Comamonas flocculans]